ncbi:hypothetical protein [Aequorivita antarctica]|uniref:Uncharacterized protein n=1 Tax=Aequorivita antarctica TaxID=153266 RepID=A0A5C6Z3X5_9FLAO|nr:hypothetical protein [Aequorivita antarctica]TXD74885.1 hypothetical protein ESU54_01460 [Aequorivita antarctica]
MNTVEKYIGRLLLSMAVFLVFGNVALASETFTYKGKTAAISELQNDDQKPFVFNEVSIGEVSQTVSQNEYTGLGFNGMFNSSQDFSDARVSSLYNSSYLLKDKRELIFRHLFPFHFFW